MDRSEFNIRIAALRAYEKQAERMRRELEKNAPAAPDADDQDAAAAKLPDGTPVATVTERAPYDRARVTDPAKFVDYVLAHFPDQLETTVNEEFTKHLLGVALHEEIPGTEVTTIKGSHTVRLTTDAYERIKAHRDESADFAADIDLP